MQKGLFNPAGLVYPGVLAFSFLARMIPILRSSPGDLVSQVIACPNCDKRLALRDELKGRTLICPQCKGRFTVPADETAAGIERFGTISNETPLPGGSDMAFLDDLAPLPRPGTAKMTRPSPATGYAASTASIASRAAAIRAKKKNGQLMMFYIGGGIVAVVLFVVAMSMPSGGDGGAKTKEKDQNLRFGMTETERRKFFMDLVRAVDEIGDENGYRECRAEWRRLGGKVNLSDQQISDIRKEGMDYGWDDPQLPATTEQKQKSNRREWIRIITETHLDPVMSR